MPRARSAWGSSHSSLFDCRACHSKESVRLPPQLSSKVCYALDETAMSSSASGSHFTLDTRLVHNHAMREVFHKHLLLIRKEIDIPEVMFVARGQLIHGHKGRAVVQSVEFFEYSH